MIAGQAHQDEFKQLRTKIKFDEPYLHDHMSN